MATIKTEILELLRVSHMCGEAWVAGGKVEQMVYQITGSKASTIRRRAQELCQAGLIEKNPEKKFDSYRLPLPQRTYEPAGKTNQLSMI